MAGHFSWSKVVRAEEILSIPNFSASAAVLPKPGATRARYRPSLWLNLPPVLISVNRKTPLTIGNGERAGSPPFPVSRSSSLMEIGQRLSVVRRHYLIVDHIVGNERQRFPSERAPGVTLIDTPKFGKLEVSRRDRHGVAIAVIDVRLPSSGVNVQLDTARASASC